MITQSERKIDSRLVTAFTQLNEKIDTEVKGQFGHTIIIKSEGLTVDGSEIDIEFDIPFDDDTEANESEIVLYNLTDTTVKRFKTNGKITVEAGYGKDTGIILSGYISKRNTVYEDCDKVTIVGVIDSESLTERDIDSIAFAKNTKASYILRTLCGKLGLPIAVFKTARDHTYKEGENVSGGLMDNIRKYARVCGVSAYVHKSKIYVRKLSDGDNTAFTLSSDTGLISVEEFEETQENGSYKDTIKGYKVKMLLQHRLQTASIISIDSKNVKGKFRVRSGRHYYDGNEFITEAEVI